MPNPFFSAFLPSVTSSLAQGGVGALQGLTQGEDLAIDRELKKAHAQYYLQHGHQQKAALEAMTRLQQKTALDPKYPYSSLGQIDTAIAGRGFNLPLAQARTGATEQLGKLREMQTRMTGLTGAARVQLLQAQADEAARRGDADEALMWYREAQEEQTRTLTEPKKTKLESEADAAAARAEKSRSDAELNATRKTFMEAHAKMYEARTKAIAAASNPNTPAGVKNQAQLIFQLTQDIEAMVMDPNTNWSDPMMKWRLDMRMNELDKLLEKGGEFGALPLGSAGPFSRYAPLPAPTPGQLHEQRFGPTTQAPTPLGPQQPSLWERFKGALTPSPSQPTAPPSPPPTTSLPPPPIPQAAPAPAPAPASPKISKVAPPGSTERAAYEDKVLAVRKLIQEKGITYVEKLLTAPGAKFTPTQRLAIQEALDAEYINQNKQRKSLEQQERELMDRERRKLK